MDAFNRRGHFSVTRRQKSLGQSRSYFAKLISGTPMIPHDGTKFMALAPEVSTPQYGEVAACLLSFYS
jgi:hypothetical protein